MQTTLHIPKIDESLMLILQHKAEERHVSVEDFVRDYLQELGAASTAANGSRSYHSALGQGTEDKNDVIARQRGTWSKAEADEFNSILASMRQIDPKLWSEPAD